MTVQPKHKRRDPLDCPEQSTDPVVTETIGRQLRQLYNQVAQAPVPDRFSELLQQLENTDRKKT